jgi:hypothetical protein
MIAARAHIWSRRSSRGRTPPVALVFTIRTMSRCMRTIRTMPDALARVLAALRTSSAKEIKGRVQYARHGLGSTQAAAGQSTPKPPLSCKKYHSYAADLCLVRSGKVHDYPPATISPSTLLILVSPRGSRAFHLAGGGTSPERPSPSGLTPQESSAGAATISRPSVPKCLQAHHHQSSGTLRGVLE